MKNRLLILIFLVSHSLYSQADLLNPRFYIALLERSEDGEDSIDVSQLLTYINPQSNIRIVFQKTYMQALAESSFTPIDKQRLDELNTKITALSTERDKEISEADASKEDSIRAKYKELINPLEKERLGIKKRQSELQLEVTATVVMKNGKTYDLEVPNYAHVATKGPSRR